MQRRRRPKAALRLPFSFTAGAPYAPSERLVCSLNVWDCANVSWSDLDDVRILSPAIIDLATTNHTDLMPNGLWNYACELHGWDEFPAYLGLSFFLRGVGIFPTYFGTMATAGTFGGIGAGSTIFWVDPERDVTFVCFTAGLLEESNSLLRFQRLSDLVHAAVVD